MQAEKVYVEGKLNELAKQKSECCSQPQNEQKYNPFLFVRAFDKILGYREPFFRNVQTNKLYRTIENKTNATVKELLEIVNKSNDKYLQSIKIVANEILKDQDLIRKFQFIVS